MCPPVGCCLPHPTLPETQDITFDIMLKKKFSTIKLKFENISQSSENFTTVLSIYFYDLAYCECQFKPVLHFCKIIETAANSATCIVGTMKLLLLLLSNLKEIVYYWKVVNILSTMHFVQARCV